MDTERIHGRLIEIEVGDTPGVGCIGVAVVRIGLPHEIGMRFEAKGEDLDEARRLVEAEIEAYFA